MLFGGADFYFGKEYNLTSLYSLSASDFIVDRSVKTLRYLSSCLGDK